MLIKANLEKCFMMCVSRLCTRQNGFWSFSAILHARSSGGIFLYSSSASAFRELQTRKQVHRTASIETPKKAIKLCYAKWQWCLVCERLRTELPVFRCLIPFASSTSKNLNMSRPVCSNRCETGDAIIKSSMNVLLVDLIREQIVALQE